MHLHPQDPSESWLLPSRQQSAAAGGKYRNCTCRPRCPFCPGYTYLCCPGPLCATLSPRSPHSTISFLPFLSHQLLLSRLRNTGIEVPISPFSSCRRWMTAGGRGGEEGVGGCNGESSVHLYVYMQPLPMLLLCSFYLLPPVHFPALCPLEKRVEGKRKRGGFD